MNEFAEVEVANKEEYDQIINFYHSVGENVSISGNEKVILAKINKKIIGSVRLVDEKDYYVLRTLYLLPEYQKRGIGSMLLKFLLKESAGKKDLYCLPYPHVKIFYEHFAFKEIPPEKLPRILEERYLEYKKEFPVVAMKHERQSESGFHLRRR